MRKSFFLALVTCLLMFVGLTSMQCTENVKNKTALLEQAQTEANQTLLNEVQPAPRINWSMERDNLIKLKKLQNDRTINFFMYVFNEGIQDPIGYYQVNKVSSINSQLTNTEQLATQWSGGSSSMGGHWIDGTLASPSEDGSYGTNGDAVFGFTPEGICIQTNMHYITSSVPLNFPRPVTRLAVITTGEARAMLEASLKAMK